MRISGRNHITEARFSNSRERIVGANSEINAGSKTELLHRLNELAHMIAAGDVAGSGAHETASAHEIAAENRRMVETAFYSQDSAWAELGSSLAAEITTRVEREGFMRTLLERVPVNQGSVPRIRVREPNVRAVRSRGVTEVWPQFVRDKYVTTDEFYITANPFVEKIELDQGSADILEDKYFEGLEAILVQEDRTVRNMMDRSVGLYNDITFFAGQLTPAVLRAAKTQVERFRLPSVNFLFSIDLLNDLTTGTDFSSYFEPISKYEIIMTGRIGRILGLDLITDGYREPTLQVLQQGEFYITTSSNMLGGYTDRGPVDSRPVDLTDRRVPARGWAMNETLSILIANAKGVQKGKRL